MVQVDKDVPRTFASSSLFAGAPIQLALRRLLLAFAAHRPDIGYVQGMNYLAAGLLMACRCSP